MAEDWSKDDAKLEVWASHLEASPKPESEPVWQAGVCVEDEKCFVYDRRQETRIGNILQFPHPELKKMCLGTRRRFGLPPEFRKTLKGLCD